jgi:HEAT repeat protein
MALTAPIDTTAVDNAFEALKTYDSGSSRAILLPIDDAVLASLRDATARRQLENRLASFLKTKLSSVAKEYVCGKLSLIGSADSVAVLAGLLDDKNLAHAARSALQAIPGPASIEALRDSLPRLQGLQKVGVINSLGARRNVASSSALAALLEDADSQVAGAAAAALGKVGATEAAQALGKVQTQAPEAIRPAVADACLACAEQLLHDGRRPEALALYKALIDPHQPKQVQLAARRGLLLVAETK